MTSNTHILVLGGSGRVGRLVVTEALRRGHQVTVLVRKADSFQPTANLTIVVGTPEHKADIARCFKGSSNLPTAVITTLAAPRASDSPFAKPITRPFFMRDCLANLTAVMLEQQIAKLAVLSSFGVGNSFSHLSWPLKVLFRHSNMAIQFQDHDAVDQHVRESGLVWTLVRPAMLKDEDQKPLRTFDEQANEVGLLASCTRANVAAFLVDAIEQKQYERKAVVITN